MTQWSDIGTAGWIEAIKSAWEPGASATQIGSALGVSRNAIIGIYDRHSKHLADYPLRSVAVHDAERKRAAAIRRERAPARFDPPRPASALSSPSPIRQASPGIRSNEPPPVALNSLLEELRAGACHWPVNDGGPFLFCGVATGSVLDKYCPHHCGLAYSPRPGPKISYTEPRIVRA